MKPYTQTHITCTFVWHICSYLLLTVIWLMYMLSIYVCNWAFEAIYMNYVIGNIISVTHTVHSHYGIKNFLYYGLVNTCVCTVHASNFVVFMVFHSIVNLFLQIMALSISNTRHAIIKNVLKNHFPI